MRSIPFTPMKSIKIVKSVEYAYTTDIKSLERRGSRKVYIPSSVVWTPICVRNHPSLVSSSKTDDNNTIVTTTLKLLTPETLKIIRQRHMVFRVTLTDDRQYLVGINGRPYTQIVVTENCPESITDNQLTEINVSFKSDHLPPYIIQNVYG